MTRRRNNYLFTRHPRSRWCGATSSFIHNNGNEINLVCTRFAEHLTHPNSKNPLQHFDEIRRHSWYEEPRSPSLPPCSSLPE